LLMTRGFTGTGVGATGTGTGVGATSTGTGFSVVGAGAPANAETLAMIKIPAINNTDFFIYILPLHS
jgi:hypothetical protein